MLTYKEYSHIVDEINMSNDITEALIEETDGHIDYLMRKHIGYCVNRIREAKAIPESDCQSLLSSLLDLYGMRSYCPMKAISNVQDITKRAILFASKHTELY